MKKIVLSYILLVSIFLLQAQERTLKIYITGTVLLTEELQTELNEEDQQSLIEEKWSLFSGAIKERFTEDFSLDNSSQHRPDSSLEDLQLEAVEKGMDLLIYGLLILQPRRALIQLSIYDPSTGNLIGSSQSFGRWNKISFINDLNESALMLLEQSDQTYLTMMEEDPKYSERNRPVRIILEPSQADVKIFLHEEEPFAVTADTPLELPFHPYPVGQEIVLRLEKEGYYTQEEIVLLDKSLVNVKIPSLIPSTDQTLVFRSNYYQLYGLGVGYRYYIKPDSLFVSAVDYLFFTPPLSDAGETALHNDLMIEGGYYPFWSKSTHLFRYGICTGAGILFTMAGTPREIYMDPYLNWATLFMEFNFSRFAVNLRFENRFNFPGENSLLPRGSMGIKLPSNDGDDKGDSLPLLGLEVIWKL